MDKETKNRLGYFNLPEYIRLSVAIVTLSHHYVAPARAAAVHESDQGSRWV